MAATSISPESSSDLWLLSETRVQAKGQEQRKLVTISSKMILLGLAMFCLWELSPLLLKVVPPAITGGRGDTCFV